MADINLAVLKSEITNDPLTRGYSGMTDAQIAASLTTANRPTTINNIPTWKLVGALNYTEYGALSANDKQLFQTLVASGQVDPSNSNVRTLLGSIFTSGASPTTRSNLLALQHGSNITRAEELGLPASLQAIHVTAAKSYAG